MQFDSRVYIRCMHNVLIEQNIFIVLLKQLKKCIDLNFELIKKPQKISKSIQESKLKFEKAKNIIDSNSKSQSNNFFNFVK